MVATQDIDNNDDNGGIAFGRHRGVEYGIETGGFIHQVQDAVARTKGATNEGTTAEVASKRNCIVVGRGRLEAFANTGSAGQSDLAAFAYDYHDVRSRLELADVSASSVAATSAAHRYRPKAHHVHTGDAREGAQEA